MKKIILLFTLTFLISFNVGAKYIQTCVVKYMTEDGWSKKYTVRTTFLTGKELNDATESFNYSTHSVYAVIFWGEGQASVIKISTILICGYEVDESCIKNTINDFKGKDQDDDLWNICVSDFCF